MKRRARPRAFFPQFSLLPAFAALLLTGCAVFKSRPLLPSQTASDFETRTLRDAGLQKFLARQGAGGGSWNVERLALAAAYFQGDAAVARAEAEEAAAGIKTAAQSPNPILSFSPAYDTTSLPAWFFGGFIDVPIETAGKRSKRIEEARAQARAAHLRAAAAAWDARTKVRAAMLDLYAARESDAMLTAEVALHKEAVRRVAARVEAGEAAAFELLEDRLGLNRSTLALQDAERLAATSRARLAASVGVPSSALDSVALEFSAFNSLPSAPGAGVRRRALTNRADLLAALADYAAADAELRLQIAKQYPDVHLSPSRVLDQTDNQWSIGLTMDLPIVNQNRGPIAQAAARRKTAGARFEARQAAVFGEIEIALAAFRAARAKAATARTLVSEATHASETTKRMVEAGELTPLDLTRRRIEASAANLSRLESDIQAQQAAGALEAALQSPLRSVK